MTEITKATKTTSLSSDKHRVMDLYGGRLNDAERVHYPDSGNEDILLRNLLTKKALGGHSVLVDGAFDVPHPSHEWYLRHCRALAAESSLLEKGVEPTDDNLRLSITNNDAILIVTVDADVKIASKKGSNPLKGNSPRPIYPWVARANRIAGYTFSGNNGTYRPVVDYVTVEGDLDHVDTPFESSLTLAQHLNEQGALDRLVVYGEHEAAIEEAISRGINPIVIPDTHDYEVNPQTEKSWRSSDIILRAQGKLAVSQHVTRPFTS
jgi:hypothetical protein